MIDSGATARTFIDLEFARKNQLPLTQLDVVRDVNIADGRPVISGAITHCVRSSMRISRHSEKVSLLATTLSSPPVVLGRPWLICHNPSIDWKRNELQFNPECASHLEGSALDVVPGVLPSQSPPQTLESTVYSTPDGPLPPLDVHSISAPAFQVLSRKKDHEIFSISLEDIDKALAPKQRIDPRTKVPKEYHHLIKVFNHQEAQKLPRTGTVTIESH